MATGTMVCPVNSNGTATIYWHLLNRINENGPVAKMNLTAGLSVEQASGGLSILSKNGMIVSEYRLWSITEKGRKYIADHKDFVAKYLKPTVHTSGKKYTMTDPVSNGRPAKFWVLLNKLFNGPVHIDQAKQEGLYYVANGLMQVKPAPIMYSRTTRCYTLTQAGMDYVKKFSSVVTKSIASYTPVQTTPTLAPATVVTPIATADLAPLGVPTAKAWIVENGVQINFPTIDDLREYIRNK